MTFAVNEFSRLARMPREVLPLRKTRRTLYSRSPEKMGHAGLPWS